MVIAKKGVLAFLVSVVAWFVHVSAYASDQQTNVSRVPEQLKQLEQSFNGKIGLYAIDTNNQAQLVYRSTEPFPVQSTFKLVDVAALLKKSMQDQPLLQKKITYSKKDLIVWSPISEKHVADGMTISDLAAAAISYSDNTAANLIMKELGGPEAVTAFAHTLGNHSFNIQHWEPHLNSNPNILQDIATPADMADSLVKLTLGHVLAKPQRTQLLSWMKANTTGNARIRAGVPKGWLVADKTGSGRYGVANDIGLIWPPNCKPIVIAVYTVRNNETAKRRDDVIASVTRIVLKAFAQSDPCLHLPEDRVVF